MESWRPWAELKAEGQENDLLERLNHAAQGHVFRDLRAEDAKRKHVLVPADVTRREKPRT